MHVIYSHNLTNRTALYHTIKILNLIVLIKDDAYVEHFNPQI
jgi:hypothetical protein